MDKNKISESSILDSLQDKIKIQNYASAKQIEGVKIFELKNFTAEDGFLCEVARFTETGMVEQIPDFQLRQLNFSRVMPGAIKAWHLHYKQDDLWYIPPDGALSVGLVDIRKDSPTKKVEMRLVMGAGKSQMVYIPAGVAHGYANLSPSPLYVFYFVNQQFNIEDPDERRLPWDIFGKDFWEVKPG